MTQTRLEEKKQTKQQRKQAEKNKNRIENQRTGKLKKAGEEVARALNEVEAAIQSLEETPSLKTYRSETPASDDYAARVLRWETYLEKFVNYLPYERKMTQDTAKGKSLASLFDAGLWHGQKAPTLMGATPSRAAARQKFG